MSKEEEKVVDNDLANFEWDSAESVEFFSAEETEDTKDEILSDEEKKIAKETIEEEKEEKEEDKKPPKKEEKSTEEKEEEEKEEKKEEKVEFFKDTEEKEEKEETKQDDFYKVLAGEMKEAGVFTMVDVPEENISAEEYIELQEKEVEERINDTFEGFFEEMDDDGKAFLKFKKEGGRTADFLNMKRETSKFPSGDIEDETFQKKVNEFYLKNVEELDEEDIEERMEWLEENGKTEKYAIKNFEKLEKIKKAKEKEVADSVKKATDLAEKNRKAFQEELKKQLDSVEVINNIPITKKEKTELHSFITKPSVKVGKGKFVTGLQDALKNISKDKEKLILLAKLVKSDFDFTVVETKATTKKTRDIKRNLERSKKNVKPNSSGGSGRKQLSDYFES